LLDLDQIHREEKQKYFLELELLRKEYGNKNSTHEELESLHAQLSQELNEKAEEIENENKYKLKEESLKLEIERERILEEYEEQLKKEMDKELDNIKRSHQSAMENEEREFEIQKMKQDQFYEEELERQKKNISLKFQNQLEELEEQKAKRMSHIESSLKEGSLTDINKNPELSKRIQEGLKEQKSLEVKIMEANKSIEDQRAK
jgi:hypothetical protein